MIEDTSVELEEIDDWTCENCGHQLCYYEQCHECGSKCIECDVDNLDAGF